MIWPEIADNIELSAIWNILGASLNDFDTQV